MIIDDGVIKNFADSLLQLALDFSNTLQRNEVDHNKKIRTITERIRAEQYRVRGEPAPPPHQKSREKQVSACIKNLEKELDALKLKVKGLSIGEQPRKDGRYMARYYANPEDTRYVYVYGRTYEQMCQNLIDTIAGRRKPKQKKFNSNSTVAEWLDNWYEKYKAPNLKAKSLYSLRCSIKVLKAGFGHIKLRMLTTDEIQTYLSQYAAKHNRAAHMALDELNRAYKKAIINHMVKENPCLGVEIKVVQPEHHKPFTREHQQRFFQTAARYANYFLFKFLLDEGVRISEALALSGDDILLGVDFMGQQYNFANIDKDAVFVSGKRIDQPTPKTKKSVRQPPLTDEIVNLYKAEYLDKGRTGLLFPITYDGARSSFTRILRAAGLGDTGYTIHSLRATFNTRLGENGVPDKLRQELMGHDEQKMTTDTYNAALRQFVLQYFDTINHTFDSNIGNQTTDFDTKFDTKNCPDDDKPEK